MIFNMVMVLVAASTPTFSAESYREATGFFPKSLTEEGIGLAVSFGTVGHAAILHAGYADIVKAPVPDSDTSSSNFSLMDEQGRLYGSTRRGAKEVRGWLWRDGKVENIHGLDFSATGGSMDQVLIGSRSHGDFLRATIFQRGRSAELPVPEGAVISSNFLLDTLTVASDIDGENICGYGYFNDPQSMACLPILWSGKVSSFLPLPNGHLHGAANGVNRQGWVAGHTCTTPLGFNVFGTSLELPEPPQWRACIWRNGTVEALTEPATRMIAGARSWHTKANGINDFGLVVGQIGIIDQAGLFRGRAALWIGKQVIDLNEAIDGDTPYPIEEAIKINNRGEILCIGVDSSTGRNARIPIILRPIRTPGAEQ